MRRAFKLWLVILLFATIFISSAPKAHASVNDFVVTNFEADYYLDQSDPQGHMDVSEQIDVDFHDYNHGILRAIPKTYHNHPLNLKIVSVTSPTGTPSRYTTYDSNDNKVLKIGDPAKTVTGAQSYLIKYSLDNVVSFFDNHDEIFWDINGDQWGQPFTSVVARFHIPENLAGNLLDEHSCYTGIYGSHEMDCQFVGSDEKSGRLLTFTAQNLTAHETLTTVSSFKNGTFTAFSWRDSLSEHKASIIIAVISLSAVIMAYRRWWRWGKDPKGSGIIVPEYGPPKGVSLLDAGILQDYRLDNKDVTAILIDLAIRGYVTVTEDDKKTLFLNTGTTTSLTLNKTDGKLTDYETEILETLFADLEPGTTVSLGKYIAGMQGVIQSIGKRSLKKLEVAGFFDKSPERPSNAFIYLLTVLSLLLSIIGFWSKNYIGAVISVLAFVVIVFLIALMPRRTKMGVMYNEQLAGLKLYLQVAEADRIKMLQGPKAKYAANAKEPKRTVELFEKLLPYAIIFGVEKDWAGQFENIYKQPPDWYNGNWSTFNTYMLASHISSATTSFNASFSPPSSSSSSGSGGGGFSGGGGGGGGGGGW